MPPDPDIRWRQRFANYQHALGELREAAQLASESRVSKLEQQGRIQAFEFTHELAWQTLKDFLEANGVTNLFGSVNATPTAVARGFIEEGESWMEMIKDRNFTVHTYDEATANRIAGNILARYVAEFVKLAKTLQRLEASEP